MKFQSIETFLILKDQVNIGNKTLDSYNKWKKLTWKYRIYKKNLRKFTMKTIY